MGRVAVTTQNYYWQRIDKRVNNLTRRRKNLLFLERGKDYGMCSWGYSVIWWVH